MRLRSGKDSKIVRYEKLIKRMRSKNRSRKYLLKKRLRSKTVVRHLVKTKRNISHEKDAEKQKSYQIGYLGMGIIPLKRGRKGKRSSDIWTRNFKFS